MRGKASQRRAEWGTGGNPRILIATADWSTGALPAPSQRACITIPLTAPVVVSGAATTGSLTLGGARGPDELLLNRATLTLGTASAVARTGVIASQGYGSIVDLAGGATLINHGKIDAAGNIQLSGDVTNAADGLVSVASYLYANTGRFTNLGAVSVQANASVQAPHSGGTGAVIDNAGGTIVAWARSRSTAAPPDYERGRRNPGIHSGVSSPQCHVVPTPMDRSRRFFLSAGARPG